MLVTPIIHKEGSLGEVVYENAHSRVGERAEEAQSTRCDLTAHTC